MPSSRTQRSAGLLVHRTGSNGLEVLIVHPGGPLWAAKDAGAWSLPKGLYDPDEEPVAAARREFAEEMGSSPPDGPVLDLGEVRLKSGKIVTGYAVEGDVDVTTVRSNTFEMAWPPRSGRVQSFPEVDRAMWCSPDVAREKLNPAQVAFVERLEAALSEQ
ncbi:MULTISPECIES: NUDIX domain-containing protein [unclassified Brachybacterium]|uniref:NUDIX domain-containing protein n=1 Tax=unclassified Brachybacterium TaxID=2623841 RepID=UPI00361D25A4